MNRPMNPQLPAMPLLGLGTWMMGESARARSAEVAAIVAGLDAGATLIDTAEMYADGRSELIVGQAIAGRRDGLYLVSKVLPHNAGHHDLLAACDRSRKRLGVDCIDLYLLHWPGSVPLAETIGAFEALEQRGAIGRWGVSNFDVRAMDKLLALPGGNRCAVNQVYYSLGERGAEFDLLPMLTGHRIAAMAYCPLDQGDLSTHPDLLPIARRLDATCAQVALAWLCERGVTAIPKSSSTARVQENLASLDVKLSTDDLDLLDVHFAPPKRATRLKIV